VLGGGEAVDGADFECDDNGQDGPDTGEGLDELHGGSELDPPLDPGLQLINLLLDRLEQFEFLEHAAVGLY
jgi:hypothetical protein